MTARMDYSAPLTLLELEEWYLNIDGWMDGCYFKDFYTYMSVGDEIFLHVFFLGD